MPDTTGTTSPEARRPPLGGAMVPGALAAVGSGFSPSLAQASSLRLAGWFDWLQALSLAAALDDGSGNRTASGLGATALAFDANRLARDERELERVRALLTLRVAEATGTAPAPLTRRPGVAAPNAISATPDLLLDAAGDGDIAIHLKRHADCQHAMEAHVGSLRRQLRATLAAGPRDLPRLARVDAVLEQVIGPRERALLAATAARFAVRFEQLRRDDPRTPGAAPAPWATPLRQEMRASLLAELDLRLQPARGLLAACRTGHAGLVSPPHG